MTPRPARFTLQVIAFAGSTLLSLLRPLLALTCLGLAGCPDEPDDAPYLPSMSNQELTSKKRAALRSEAHGLKPMVFIGAGGVTDAVLSSVREAFNTRELLKMRVLEGAPASLRETADEVQRGVPGSAVIQMIGRIAVLYRPKPDDEESGAE